MASLMDDFIEDHIKAMSEVYYVEDKIKVL